MAPSHESRIFGLEDLRWQSLTKPEKLLVAGLLETAHDAPKSAHLENVAFELRDAASAGGGVALVLTSSQNRAIAEVIEKQAGALEAASGRFHASPAIARSAHYAAGFLRSLVDRLVRGGSAAPQAARDRVLQLLLLDVPKLEGAELERALVHAADERLETLGVGTSFQPVLKAYSAEAVAAAASAVPRVAPVDDASFDFEIAEVNEEQMKLAAATFDASIAVLAKGTPPWSSFVSDLMAGQVPGCEPAKHHPNAAESAARTAFELVASIRAHLQELAGSPLEAVSPGLKAIVDAYPALKRQPSLQAFVDAEVKRCFGGKGKPSRASRSER
ncbi:MAG TPA: hypothetical protein VGK67_31220 [Myxococcales bacterium]|jgi:hypothetical protein